MSVDTLRETFHINRIKPSEIDDFMSAQTYRPDIINAYSEICALPHAQLQNLCSTKIKQGPTPIYADTGVACLKSKHTVDLICSEPDDELVSPNWAKEHKDDQVKSGDLVITRQGAGTIGRVSIFLEEISRNTNDSLFKVSLSKADSAYIAAYLRTFTGQRLLEKGVYGSTGQLNLSCEHVRRLPVLLIDDAGQKYIGDKVRQAARLRAWAKELESEFDSSLRRAVPEAFENKSTGRKYSKALTQEITYTLNPGAFDEERLRVQRYLLGLGGQRFRALAEITALTTNSYKPANTYIGLDAIASGNSQLSPSTVEQAEIAGTCRLLTEGPVIAKLRPYLNKVSYIPKRLSGAVGSTELLCVSPLGSNSGWYIYGILKSELTLKQLRPLATGATHPRIDQYDVYDLVVPVLDNQESLGYLLEQAQEAYFLSTELISAAKFLVEALIEGNLTESQLISAEQALQAGNDQPDRRILSRLKTDGTDGQGQPLFSDLDQLYSLLEQVAHF